MAAAFGASSLIARGLVAVRREIAGCAIAPVSPREQRKLDRISVSAGSRAALFIDGKLSDVSMSQCAKTLLRQRFNGRNRPSPIRRKPPFPGLLARKNRSMAQKIGGIGPYLGRLANSISETSSQLTPPSSGESRANRAARCSSYRPVRDFLQRGVQCVAAPAPPPPPRSAADYRPMPGC